MGAEEPGVPVRVGEHVSSTSDTPDARLHQLLDELRAALQRIDLAATRRHLALVELHAERVDGDTGRGRATFYARACRAMFALTEGDLVGAAGMTDEAERIASSAPVQEGAAVVRTLRNDRARQLRDREGMATGAAACEGHAQSCSPGPVALAARAEAAVLWLESGNATRAGALVDRWGPQVSTLEDGPERVLVLSRFCEAAIGCGRRVVAAECARLLRGHAHRAVVAPHATAFGGVVDDYLALATGDRDAATRARASYEQLGAWWWARRRALDLRPSTSLPRVLHLHPSRESAGVPQWCVGADGQTRLVTAMPGLEHLRTLLHHPGQDLGAAELVTGETAPQGRRRILVRQAIAAATARLDMVDPELTDELRATIRTGLTCRYDPDPRQPTAWHLELDVSHAAYDG